MDVGSIIKWGTHYLGFQRVPTPPDPFPTLGFVFGGWVICCFVGSFVFNYMKLSHTLDGCGGMKEMNVGIIKWSTK